MALSQRPDGGFHRRLRGRGDPPAKEELSEAAFFDRNRLPPLPPPLSLARRMIDWWLDRPSSR
ncbi:MAG: hypothetical protein ACLR8Y_15145 [Alistipes indistinctus]